MEKKQLAKHRTGSLAQKLADIRPDRISRVPVKMPTEYYWKVRQPQKWRYSH
ncbi:hypothetical protein AGMMS49992_21610 [Clostridia bacterium]|nr:hypothetical protein AGMMS49992_21610 [Clostridia bacterium]